MSRDQLTPMIIAAGYWDKEELRKIAKGHLKRGFLFTNNTRRNGANKINHGKLVAGEIRNYDWKIPDPTGPSIWSNFIRAYNFWPLYPLLLLFDIELFVNSILWRYFRKDNIAMNYTLTLLQANDRMPTPWGWLSRKIMPVKKLIKLIGEHFTDFGHGDMYFFKPMFEDAWESVTDGDKKQKGLAMNWRGE